MQAEDIMPGTPVIYWAVVKANNERFEPRKTMITSHPWQLGHGEYVCTVEGITGGVSVRHLFEMLPSELMKARQGGMQITEADVDLATKVIVEKNARLRAIAKAHIKTQSPK